MRFIYITFRSVTGAMEAKAILERRGIIAVLRRTPEALRSRGCGYSLRLRLADGQMADHLLTNIRFEKIFLETAQGKWQEVVL